MNAIRAFIALDISDEARSGIGRIIGVLKDAQADVKWTRSESLHLTLKFLGSIPEGKVEGIGQRLEEIAKGTGSFDIGLSDIGVFPGWNRAKVLWIGVNPGEEQVKNLANCVEAAMCLEGRDKEEREFSVHLTLGRIKSKRNIYKLKELAESIKVIPAVSHITKITLFKSDLTSEGVVHTPLVRASM